MTSETRLIKVGPAKRSLQGSPKYFDLQGRSEISQIFVSGEETGIESIQFQYVENGKYVLSHKYGSHSQSNQFHTIQLNHPAEYITGVSGLYSSSYGKIKVITFTTNIKEYSPFGVTNRYFESPSCFQIPFNYNLGKSCQFGGFHGVYDCDGLLSIGLYLNISTVPPSSCSKIPKKELK